MIHQPRPQKIAPPPPATPEKTPANVIIAGQTPRPKNRYYTKRGAQFWNSNIPVTTTNRKKSPSPSPYHGWIHNRAGEEW